MKYIRDENIRNSAKSIFLSRNIQQKKITRFYSIIFFSILIENDQDLLHS